MTETRVTAIESATARRIRRGLLLFCLSIPAISQTSAQQPEAPTQAAQFPVNVLVKGPADTETDLQIICLFRSDPSNTLHGSLIEMNQKLQGLLDSIRTPSLFSGEEGETLLITPKPGTIPARRLLIIGLGDSHTFTPARMNLVGAIVYTEANRLGVKNPFFAPTILDGGVTGFNTGDVAQQFMSGFLRARAVQAKLTAAGEAPHETIERLTFLAGAAHATDTQAGLAKANDAPNPH